MAKIDWSKGYTLDPARAQREEFLPPDQDVSKAGKKKQPTHAKKTPTQKLAKRKYRQQARQKGSKALQHGHERVDRTRTKGSASPARSPVSITQDEALVALGMPKSGMKPKERGGILKRLVAEGVLLPTGKPNPDHPKIVAIIARRSKPLSP